MSADVERATFWCLSGEKSGDILAGSVLRELKRRNEALRVTGIGGEATALHGLDSLFDMDRLAVFGLVEPLKRLLNSYRFAVLLDSIC